MSPPLTPSREQARRWAEHELSKPEYRDADLSPLEKLGRAISRFTDDLLNRVADIDSPWMLLGIGLLIAGLIVLLVVRLRRGVSGGIDIAAYDRSGTASLPDPQEHWAAARRAAAAGDYRLAVEDGVRAIFADLVRSGVIDMTAASTASELAHAAARAAPALSTDVLAVGTLFDAVAFGQAHAGPADFAEVEQAGARIAAAADAHRASGPGTARPGSGAADADDGEAAGPAADRAAAAAGTGAGSAEVSR